MTDRVVEYPNQYTIEWIDKDAGLCRIVQAPGAVAAEGSRYCKANVLPDDTCNLLGLDPETAELKDALTALDGKVHFKDYYTSAAGLQGKVSSALGQPRLYPSGASVGDYALIAGGTLNGSGNVGDVDAYRADFVKQSCPALSVARSRAAGVSTDAYAMFAAGLGSGWQASVDFYNANLVRTQGTGLINGATPEYAGAANGTYAMLLNGSIINIYNSDMVQLTPIPASTVGNSPAAARARNTVVFTGHTVKTSNSVYYYHAAAYAVTRDLVGTCVRALDSVVQRTGASVGDYALFAGGWNPDKASGDPYRISENISGYTDALVAIHAGALSAARSGLAGVSTHDFAVYHGGAHVQSVSNSSAVTDVFNAALLHIGAPQLWSAESHAGAAAGDHCIFAGGAYVNSSNTSSLLKTAVMYQDAGYRTDIRLPAFCAY